MSKGRRNRQKRRKGRHGAHRDPEITVRRKKVLTPPFLTMPNLNQVSWPHDGLLDFIWLQAIREETGDLAAVNKALDVLDEFVPEPPETSGDEEPDDKGRAQEADEPRPNEFLDGRISNLPLVAEDRRAEAREELRDRAPWAIPDALGARLRSLPGVSRRLALVGSLPPYDLRHAFASLQIRSGMSIPELAEQMGHSPQMTVGTYAHVIRELKGEPSLPTAEQIERLAGKALDVWWTPTRVEAA